MTMDDDVIEPSDDPDVIPVDGSTAAPFAGPMFFTPGSLGMSVPLSEPAKSTPLDDDEPDGPIPPAPLWAMKYRRHFHLSHRPEDEVRETLGAGDGAIYLINDGRKRFMISRQVGHSPDGCMYCLVGTISIETYERYVNGEAALDDVFSDAKDLAVCAVFDTGPAVSNVAVAETFDGIDDVPLEYLPSHSLIQFEDTADSEG